MDRVTLSVVFAGLLGLPASLAVHAQDEAFDRTPVDCIQLNRLMRTEVLDERTIVFHQRGGRAYRNYMPRDCPGLERERRFAYRVSAGRLCSTDTVTVLERGGGVSAGFTCRLGDFHPITAEELEELRIGPAQQLEVTPVEASEDDAEPEDGADQPEEGDGADD